jgi:hypothetical protein
MISIKDMRTNVAARVSVADSTIVPDILDPKATQDDLICLMDRVTAPNEKGGLGYKLLITALHRDHHWDGDLGPHGHDPGPDPQHILPGYSVDCWPQSGTLKQFLHDMIYCNRWVTKIGLGGPEAQSLYPQAANDAITVNGVVIFYDNSSDHIHLQTQ